MRKQKLAGLLALLVVVAPLTMQRCGTGLDTDKTLKLGFFGSSGGPSASPSYSGKFDPSKLSSLRAWFKADYFASVGLTDGTTIATSAVWVNAADSTGTTNVTSNSNSAVFYQSAGPNGAPIVRFNGGTYFNNPSSGFDTSASGMSIFVVGKRMSSANPNAFFSLTSTASFVPATDDYIKFGGPTGTTGFEINKMASQTFNSGYVAYDNLSHIFMGVWNPSSSGSEYYVYGSQLGTSSGTGTVTLPLNLSTNMYLGWDGNYYLTGDISEVIVYTRGLTLPEQELIITYLKHKYAL